MKKIVYVSNESIIAGNGKCGIADVVDGLSNACSKLYDVCVITEYHGGYIAQAMNINNFIDGVQRMKILGVQYYLIEPHRWDELVHVVIDMLEPDILHNFADPNILNQLSCKPNVSVYTIDHVKYAIGNEEKLSAYDVITTVSKSYAQDILSRNDDLSDFLSKKDFRGITNGIVDSVFNPATGFFLDAKYSIREQTNKAVCKQGLLDMSYIEGNPLVFAAVVRLSDEKGIDSILASAQHIKNKGGVLLLYGRGDKQYEDVATELHNNGVIHYIKSPPKLTKLIPILAGADFYLSPSKEEPCGLMPMMASRYGAIPITTLVGGLKDNFNASNAIIIEDDLNSAIDKAFEMKPLEKRFMTAMVMSRNFSWKQRKEKYVDIYEQR